MLECVKNKVQRKNLLLFAFNYSKLLRRCFFFAQCALAFVGEVLIKKRVFERIFFCDRKTKGYTCRSSPSVFVAVLRPFDCQRIAR